MASCILDFEMVVLSSVLELLREALLDGRIIALYEVIVAELNREGRLANAARAQESDLALSRGYRLA